MKKYYRLQDEDDWKNDDTGNKEEKDKTEDDQGEEEEEEEAPVKTKKDTKKGAGRKVASPPSSSEEEAEEEEAEAAKRWARMRGLDATTSSSSDEDTDSDDDLDTDGSKEIDEDREDHEEAYSDSDFDDDAVVADEDDEAAAAEFGVGALAANPKEQIPLLPDATPRLACVDLDWENITAVDILVALRSFIPRGGSIKSVTVYPSDYGLERMEAEAKSGPRGIWKMETKTLAKGGKKGDRENAKHRVEASSDSEDEENDEENEDDDSVKEESESDADGEVDHARLRLYERSKLRWYYAIVDCDSTETANQLYDECDGMELMKSK